VIVLTVEVWSSDNISTRYDVLKFAYHCRGGRVQTSDIHNLVKKIPMFPGVASQPSQGLLVEGEVHDFV
jgi:hypothetical protein